MRHIKLFEQFIDEKAVPFEEILKDETQQGLVIDATTRNGEIDAKLVLYDFDDDKILGYMDMLGLKSGDFFEVNNVFAEKNYGPVMYDASLMYAYPKSVKPDIVIKPAAIKVWTYYKDSRTDVTKVPVSKKSANFATKYQDTYEGPYIEDQAVVDLINTMFSMKPNDEYKKLVDVGKTYVGKYDINVKDLMKRARKQFEVIYYGVEAE